jgi:hypothetical protein
VSVRRDRKRSTIRPVYKSKMGTNFRALTKTDRKRPIQKLVHRQDREHRAPRKGLHLGQRSVQLQKTKTGHLKWILKLHKGTLQIAVLRMISFSSQTVLLGHIFEKGSRGEVEQTQDEVSLVENGAGHRHIY